MMSYKQLMEQVPFVALRSAHRLRMPFQVEAAYLDSGHGSAYGRLAYLPFHAQLAACDFSFEPAFIQKRNERERHRVRCVNEGYARLREHLPREYEDKRLSKVETLRAAIDYIKHLQRLLEASGGDAEAGGGARAPRREGPQSKAAL